MPLSALAEEAQKYLELIEAREALDLQIGASRVRLAELAGTKEEGAQTVEVGDYKITTRATVRRKVIEENLPEALNAIDSRWLDVVRVKHSIDKKRLDQMEREDRAAWLKMTRAIEMSVPSIGVTVRKIEVEA